MSASYLQALRSSLPTEYLEQINDLCKNARTEALLENLTRFTAGAEPSVISSDQTRQDWRAGQSVLKNALDALSTLGQKRGREDDTAELQNGVKRQKLPNTPPSENDLPLFCLHSVSATSPVRKKVDIFVHESSIRFTHPTSHVVESVVPLSSIRRVFIVPTRGKQKPHWTVILLASDAPERGKPSSSSPQVIFGLDAIASSVMTTTSYSSITEPVKSTLAKATETLPLIMTLLSHTRATIIQPTPDVFRSACPGNISTSASSGGVPGIEAYRAAKPGTLWFMKEGLLWGENKPCEFWALEDLMGKSDGLRMLSATGRTCSVILTRKGAEPEEGNESEEDIGTETEFAMVDGKEQEGINNWVRQYRHLFGKRAVHNAQAGGEGVATAGGNATTLKAADLGDDSDSSDESFGVDSDDSDGGSASSDSSEDESDNASDGGGSGSGGSGSGAESKEGEEPDGEGETDEDEDDLKREHHPLLRPGAMPKMSKAAIDAVVGMVNDDLMGDGISDGEDELMDD